MTCSKINTKKYSERPSPPYKASQCKTGSKKRGNNGEWYVVSKPNVNGVKRWIKYKKPSAKETKGTKGTKGTKRTKATRGATRMKLYCSWSEKYLTTTVYFKRPKGKIMVYDKEDQRFSELIHHPADDDYPAKTTRNRIDIASAKDNLKKGYKIWYVEYMPRKYEP